MKKIEKFTLFTILFLAMPLFVTPAFGAMGLTSGDQIIRGQKTFDHDATFKRNVRIEGALLKAGQVGDVFYVRSTTGADRKGNNYGLTYDKPWATIDYAINQTTASVGDTIIVLPYHTESYTAANGFDADVAGIFIIGVGTNAAMPRLVFADTDATVAIGAANVTIDGINFAAGISEVVVGIMVEAAGDGFTLSNCLFEEPTSSAYEFDSAINFATTATDISIIGNTYFNADATGGDHFIDASTGTNPNLQIIGNYIVGEFAVAAIFSNKVDLEVLIRDNYIFNMTSGQHAVEFTGAATGMILNNAFSGDTYLNTVDPGSMSLAKNTISVGLDSPAVAFPQFEDGALRSVVKTDGAVLTGDDDLFVITGGPIKNVKIIGIVTTIIGGASNGDLQIDVTEPAATVDLNVAPVAIDTDAAGTMYMNIDSTSVFTPITNGASIIDDVAAPEAYFNLPVGTVIFRSSAAQTGVIQWTMTYEAGPGVTVTAAP